MSRVCLSGTYADLLCLLQKNHQRGRTQGNSLFILTYKFATNDSFKVYQITAHKIQVYDESDRPVEPRLLPQFPGGQDDNDDDTNPKKEVDLLAAFMAKKKLKMDTE